MDLQITFNITQHMLGQVMSSGIVIAMLVTLALRAEFAGVAA